MKTIAGDMEEYITRDSFINKSQKKNSKTNGQNWQKNK